MNILEQRYQRAEQLLPWNLALKLNNLSVEPHWLDQTRFWFKRDNSTPGTYEFVLVECAVLREALLFDHQRLADNLAGLLDQPVDAQQLPINALVFREQIPCRFVVSRGKQKGKAVLFSLENYHCRFADEFTLATDTAVPSIAPGGQRDVICRAHNLVLRERATGEETALTVDGDAQQGYGNYAEDTQVSTFENQPLPPAVVWSADGRYLAVQRIDKRALKTRDMPLVQCVPTDGSLRPQYRPYKVNIPGDPETELGSLCVIDVNNGDIVHSDRTPVQASVGAFIDGWGVRWGDDHRLYHTEWSTDRQVLRLIAFDPATGSSRVLLEERQPQHGYLHPGPAYGAPALFKILTHCNAFIWYSHDSGWGHLYLYDLSTGQRKNAITAGEFVVTELYHVDTDKGCVYFAACGREPDRNPYYNHFYRVNLDGSELVLLTPEPSQHDRVYPIHYAPYVNVDPSISSLSPDARVFIDTFSRVDQPPTSVLRSTQDGAVLMTLSHCDTCVLNDTPYTPPQPFTAKAADGSTDLWGVLHKPSDFDESQHYPVVLALYGGPHCCVAPTRFAECKEYTSKVARTLAELGCIVVTLDPRGTPYRAKAFIDEGFGNYQNGGGIDDQVAALKQLGERYSWMDLNRVGITGHSSGGYASARAMLTHSDFFKVGVSGAGLHDHRLYVAGWVETFQGPMKGDNFEALASARLAHQLKGKLLLTQGDMDTNVHIANTLQLVDQLIAHNKDFDLLILPNRQHNYTSEPYFIRRLWDYFVEHLLEQTPPKNYCIKPAVMGFTYV
jgi:dipeptidyl-peptidase-4